MEKNQRLSGFLLTLPSLIGVCAFYVIPFGSSLYYAFTQGVTDTRFVGVANFRELAQNAFFRQAAGNTILFLAAGVPLVLLLSLAVSVILVKGRFTWQRWALLLPFVIPSSSMAVAWRSLWAEGGTVASLLRLSGDPLKDWAFGLTMLLYLLRNVGYISVILTSAIRALPAEYQESYCLDSGSEWGYTRRIMTPLISPSLLFGGIVAVMNYFLLFRDVYLLYGETPPARLYMLQHFMNNNFYKLNYQRLSAAAFLTVLCLSALAGLILLLQRRVKSHVE